MILSALQIIVALFLIVAVLLQAKGGGLSPAFGGGGEMYRSRQSIEKLLVILTVIFAVCLGALSLILLIF